MNHESGCFRWAQVVVVWGWSVDIYGGNEMKWNVLYFCFYEMKMKMKNGWDESLTPYKYGILSGWNQLIKLLGLTSSNSLQCSSSLLTIIFLCFFEMWLPNVPAEFRLWTPSHTLIEKVSCFTRCSVKSYAARYGCWISHVWPRHTLI